MSIDLDHPNLAGSPQLAGPTEIIYPKAKVAPGSLPAVITNSFTITGTASCELLKDIPGDESGILVRPADEKLTAVKVRVGAAGPVDATPTGPAATPWTSWTFSTTGLPAGPVSIKFEAFPSRDPAPVTRFTTVDLTPPTVAINPPADVVRPAPPYIATITGTAADSPAGVVAVEWQLAGGAFAPAGGTTSWSADVALPGLGVHTIGVRARDAVGNVGAPVPVSVRVGDITAPSLAILTPAEGDTRPLTDGKATFEVRGNASDTQSGVATVEWALDGGPFAAATAQTPDWSVWSAQVPVTTSGNHTLTVRATDKASPGNVTTLQRGIVVAEPFHPADPDAVFSPSAYLDDLLAFATHRAKISTGGAFITRQLLVDTYLQPFVDLVSPDNRVVANQPVSQLRPCVDVLRRYLAGHAGTVPAAAEAGYRQAMYVGLLRQLGTSHEELRLSRTADVPARTALADRLGIALARFRPDRLDQLVLQPAALSEAALKTLFGVEETTVKPLVASILPEPALLTWQKERLRTEWQAQDDAAATEWGTPVPLIDPDLIGTGDLRTPNPGNPAYDLWKARTDDVAAHAAQLDTLRKGQKTQQAGFDKIVAAVAPIAELLALATARQQGTAIDAQLRARHLTLAAFLQLIRVRQLAATGTVLDAEWADVYAVLVQVRKIGLYATWRRQEQQKGLILGPDAFGPAAAALVIAGTPTTPATLPLWRATPQARQAWRRTLDARIQQERALVEALGSAVAAAEQAALPLLRDACVAAIAGTRDPKITADRLTHELGIDCRDSGTLRTTRVEQALETVQEILLSLRTGRLKSEPPVLGTTNPAAAWVLALDPAKPYTESDFDDEWVWMGGYATWHAAIGVFAYPETYLLPELRPAAAQTGAYRQLMADLRNQARLTPVQARALARTYHLALATELAATLPATLRPGALTITEQLTDTQLAARRIFIRDTLFAGVTDRSKAPAYVQEIFYFVPLALAIALQKSGQFLVALDWIETFYTDHLAPADRKIYRGLVLEESIATAYQRNPDNWLRVGLNPHEIATVRASAHTRFTLITLVRCYLDFADAEFTRDDGESVARARSLYQAALTLLTLPEMAAPGTGSGASPFPANPVPAALQLRAELNLFKLRSGRSIAGIERQATSIGPSQAVDRLPSADAAPQPFRPTPYRYTTLIGRAKNLVSIAQQVEQAFLAALERRDAETYNLLKAGHDLQLAGATVDLHALQVTEAAQGVELAQRQVDRAEGQRDTYQGWIDAGLNDWETATIAAHVAAGAAGIAVVAADAVLTSAQAATAAASGGFLGTGLSGGLGAAAAVGVAAYLKAGAQGLQIGAETTAQVSAAKASFERRSQEWQLQRQLAEGEVAIGNQQVVLAQTHTDIARQEQQIAETQLDHARATVEFLAHKFTNAELYAWMSGVLGGAYNYFLQQATALARQAQDQLAFERQENPPGFIKADYWEDPDAGAGVAASGSGLPAPDRQGLTGSVRLLADITRLDQFAFDTDRRKLQLSQTFSLARIAPAEFQRFRETGVLPFATPMDAFDAGFPGHYLRTVKRVHVSLVALVPPDRGVRATLIGSGISRVVTGGDVFTTVNMRRDPEAIAFTSTANATGLLELEPDAGMLLPFEGTGVDTSWELQLPKPANPFDFASIADVLFTVDYTALQDFSYRHQVITQLDDRRSAERAISVRDAFPDQWYALHNPVSSAPTPGGQLGADFTLPADSFGPNLDEVAIQQVLFAVVRRSGTSAEVGPVGLTLTPVDGQPVSGSVGSTVDGLISTRRGNASGWVPLVGRSPVGGWRLTLPDTADVRARFAGDEIEDLLIVLTYQGRTPPWPA